MGKYLEAGGKRFTEHDLRAKVASDSEDLDVAQARLQHQSRTTTNRVYRRAPTKVKVLRRKPVPDTNS
jgi:integrase